MISPNWREDNFVLFVVALAEFELPSTADDRTLCAFVIGSATRQPTILADKTNRYTCKQKVGDKVAMEKISTTILNHVIQRKTDTKPCPFY